MRTAIDAGIRSERSKLEGDSVSSCAWQTVAELWQEVAKQPESGELFEVALEAWERADARERRARP
jgi:hypothetical protein